MCYSYICQNDLIFIHSNILHLTDFGHPSALKMMDRFSDCERFQMALLPSVYGCEFILALAGNLFAILLLVVRERRNWHTGMVFSCNLAISDLLYVMTLPLLIVYYSNGKSWIFGDTACKLEGFLFTCNLYVSIFFVMAISVNQCVALVWPFFNRSSVTPAHAKAVSVIIWITVGAISCPVLKYTSICVYNNKTLCVSFCGETQGGESYHFIYKIFLGVFGCLVPFLVTFTSYCVVFWVVWRNVNISTLEKRKVALLVTSVLVLYAISFVPYNVLMIYNFYLKSYGRTNNSLCRVYDMYQVSKGLAALNMCVHPILYTALIDSIRVTCCGKSPAQCQHEKHKRAAPP